LHQVTYEKIRKKNTKIYIIKTAGKITAKIPSPVRDGKIMPIRMRNEVLMSDSMSPFVRSPGSVKPMRSPCSLYRAHVLPKIHIPVHCHIRQREPKQLVYNSYSYSNSVEKLVI